MLIEYYGLELDIPRWARYVATDEDGTVVVFDERPVSSIYGYWDISKIRGGQFLELGKYTIIDAEGEWWKSSLMDYGYNSKFKEASSEIKNARNIVLRENKNAWQHIVKILCYKGNTEVVDARRDLFKHISDIVNSLKVVGSIISKTKALSKRLTDHGYGDIYDLLTFQTEENIRKESLESIVKEYSKLHGQALVEKCSKVREDLNDIYLRICVEFYRGSVISLKLFRRILLEEDKFKPHELTEIFKGKEDL